MDFVSVTFVDLLLLVAPLCLARGLPPPPLPNDAGDLLWPRPQPPLLLGRNVFTLHPSKFSLVTAGFSDCPILEDAFQRFTRAINLTLAVRDRDLHLLHELALHLEDNATCGVPPTLEDDNSYHLAVNASGFFVGGKTVWGILHGLETLSQLVYVDHATLQYRVHELSLADQPRWRYRGTTIDTSVHYIAVDVIKQHLDAMAMNKLNVLHWILVGNDSWPLEIKGLPRLTKKAAYSPLHVYSQEQIREVVDHARDRGIVVLPDLNLPSSVASIAKAYPDSEFVKYCNGTPSAPHPYADGGFLSTLLSEVKVLFGGASLHLGTLLPCPTKDTLDLDRRYASKLLNLVMDAGFETVVFWDLAAQYRLKLTPELIQNVSATSPLPSNPLRNFEPSDFWPLYDGELWMMNHGKEHQNVTNRTMNHLHFLGGETARNGRQVDGTNFFSILWPTPLLVAEKLWAPAEREDPARKKERLQAQRCRMIRRDIPIPPLNDSDVFCEVEWRTGPLTGVDLEDWREWYRPETTTTTSTPVPTTLGPPFHPHQRPTFPQRGQSRASGHFSNLGFVFLASALLLLSCRQSY